MLRLLLAFNAFTLFTACVGMMAVFMGGGGYVQALLIVLIISLPVSLASALIGYTGIACRRGLTRAWRSLWNAIPKWLIFGLSLTLALIACGELALVITLQLADEAPRFFHHLPLVAALLSAAGYCAVHALRHIRAAPDNR